MIEQISKFFSNCFEVSDEAPVDDERSLRLATAALLIEVSRADFSVDDTERQAVIELLDSQFELTKQELEKLIELAEQEADQATSLYQFTRLINDAFSAEQKRQLVLNLWKVALADGYIDKHEDHLIRKVADLIHVSHKDFIRAKLTLTENSDS
ncbi:TerB family tellurite resistance protein [Motiliproteus coralliicola]|uniref:TerB family tellurite resistance protein n=1 Tax=Motiliproteus coralliicola TaxID=2283196 RepID=A0A369WKN1_9GAMM|nr:TerB family tellurite resistance protein [Motiliproteus coralliicola]RDE22620.1 TerB family tellurite resistance protein [Motiliproteus coralliicola]